MASFRRTPPGLPALAAIAALLTGCVSSGANTAAPADETAEETASRVPVDPAEVTAEDIERSPRSPLLQGRFAGVQVIPTAGGVQVRIRGQSTIRGDSEPLYIVDGVPVRPFDNGTLPLAANDIASIRVLKDAVSTTMYGVRGANGVVVIRTKQP